MRVVIDSNRLMAALIKDSINRKIILSDQFDFYSPDYLVTEIEKHRNYLLKKSHLSKHDFDILLFTLLQNINLVPFEDFKHKYLDAMEIMKDIDVDDSPFIALALAIKPDGIWSEDKGIHQQNRIRVFTTKELTDILE